MQRISSITTDHQVILEGLHVLRLIADRMEKNGPVEADDQVAVLGFLRDVGCVCISNTEQLILRPALDRARNHEHIRRLQSALACCYAVQPLFDDLASEVTFRKFFVLHSKLFTNLVSDIILEGDRSLLQLAVDLLDDAEGRTNIEKFAETERRIGATAIELIPALQRLEAKYGHFHTETA